MYKNQHEKLGFGLRFSVHFDLRLNWAILCFAKLNEVDAFGQPQRLGIRQRRSRREGEQEKRAVE